jgi:thioredoxin-like negative regulator of GroEL
MIERLALAGAILGVLILTGNLVRAVAARRRAIMLAGAPVQASPSGLPRVIAFSGPGCAACTTQRRILDDLAGGWKGAVEIAYVDAVAENDLARRFGVMVVPTTVVAAADGRIVGVNGGLVDGDRLRAQIATA